MTEVFTHETWKACVATWWRKKTPDWRLSMKRMGVETAYGMLAASAFLPLLEVYAPTDPGPAVAALSLLTAGVGSNLVANVVQNNYTNAAAPRQIEREIAEQPERGFEEVGWRIATNSRANSICSSNSTSRVSSMTRSTRNKSSCWAATWASSARGPI